MIRSPFFYVGDKSKLMNQLKEYFPKKINSLIEPFVGGGSVFLNTPANNYITNDIDLNIINLHKCLYSYKSNPDIFIEKVEKIIVDYKLSASYLGKKVDDELRKKYVKTYYSKFNKVAYNVLKNDFNNEQTNYIKLYVLLVYGFNHMLRFNNSGLFNLPVGNVDYNKNVVQAIYKYIDFCNRNVIEFHCGDYGEFLTNLEFKKDDFVYLDPPYLITASEYNKLWSKKDEMRLLSIIDTLNDKGVRFALSNVLIHKGKQNEILIDWSKKYKVIKIKSNYISYHDNSIKETIEVLITNY